MKTLAYTSALAAILILTSATQLTATTPDLKSGDVKFDAYNLLSNTSEINIVSTNALEAEFEIEEENYINDIPFSTECVTVNCRYEKAMSVVFELDEELYVDDIPFNTEKIVENSNIENFNLEEEAYIDDIPFNTGKVVEKTDFMNNLTVK